MRPALPAAIALAASLVLSGCAVGATAPGAGATASDDRVASTPSSSPTPSAPPDVPPAPAPAPSVPLSDASLGAAATAPTVPPVRVEVPSLGIDISIAAESVDDTGALALPENPDVASWYRWGPSPWNPEGATVIASHVDSLEYGLGQFARLPDATAGTRISVTAADGRVADFEVQHVDLAEKDGIDWGQVFDREGPARLVLITCGGEFDYDTGHYRSNVIVTAVPVPAA
ncbi:class F sortase [Herbiconiux sp. CPCC 203407]|uniref:Class F sortase n=1 Tax=Herbiconiux oxytropis TaxID=2970915 RepID=A0AA42BUF2_9MICO|nr:class F sortase [Herbiconiux oxytropis]MCS5723549.1 class F sortase [Herbiconiux oxytropis]MCS5727475.1 class F sortase [Herbiconiux oxytropis]